MATLHIEFPNSSPIPCNLFSVTTWRRFFCLFLVTFLIAGKATFAMERHELAHAIDHAESQLPEAGSHDHGAGKEAGPSSSMPAGDDKAPPFDEAEHRLLHSASCMQFAIAMAELACMLAPLQHAVVAEPLAVDPRHRPLEPPLRPPRFES